MSKLRMVHTRSQSEASVIDPSELQEIIKNILQTPAVIDTLAGVISGIVIKNYEQRLVAAETRILQLEKELATKEETIKTLDQSVHHLEQYFRRNCIRIFGVPESKDENTDSLALNLFKEHFKINLQHDAIDRFHRIGIQMTGKCRPLIIKFTRYNDRDGVFRRKRFLKGTNFSVREDLTQRNLNLYNSAIKLFDRRNVWTRDGVVYICQN